MGYHAYGGAASTVGGWHTCIEHPTDVKIGCLLGRNVHLAMPLRQRGIQSCAFPTPHALAAANLTCVFIRWCRTFECCRCLVPPVATARSSTTLFFWKPGYPLASILLLCERPCRFLTQL